MARLPMQSYHGLLVSCGFRVLMRCTLTRDLIVIGKLNIHCVISIMSDASFAREITNNAPTKMEILESNIISEIKYKAQQKKSVLCYNVVGQKRAKAITGFLCTKGYKVTARWAWEWSLLCPPWLAIQLMVPPARNISIYTLHIEW
jgi:hypothetical protein